MIKNRYLYNDGSELQDDLNLGVFQTYFRMLDPTIGRWWQIDPKADFKSLVSWTPYNYSINNPIRWNDPLGDCPPGMNCNSQALVLGELQKAYDGIAQKVENATTAVGKAFSDAGKTVSDFVKPKIQVAIYGSGGAPVIKGNEASDDKVTIPVDLGDLPSPQGAGLKGENSFAGLISDFVEFLGFTDNAVNVIEEVQGNSTEASESNTSSTSGNPSKSDTTFLQGGGSIEKSDFNTVTGGSRRAVVGEDTIQVPLNQTEINELNGQ